MMEKNQKSHVAVISSVQGKIGIPLRTSYAGTTRRQPSPHVLFMNHIAASKHALQAYFDGLRAEVESQGVAITVVSPGYVRTSLSLNALRPDGSKHGEMDETTAKGMDPSQVAKDVLRAIVDGERDVVLADAKSKLAIQAKVQFPDLIANVIKMKMK
jgi:short-subunit dehydrogenase